MGSTSGISFFNEILSVSLLENLIGTLYLEQHMYYHDDEMESKVY